MFYGRLEVIKAFNDFLLTVLANFSCTSHLLQLCKFVHISIGECKLENMRTLCVACHYDVTVAQCTERRMTRANAKKQLKVVMNNMKNDLKGAAGSIIEVYVGRIICVSCDA